MSDVVTISLISTISSLAAAMIGVFNNILARRNERHIAATKDVIVTLEKNTKSIKHELVRVIGASEKAKGFIEGKAAERAKHNDDESR